MSYGTTSIVAARFSSSICRLICVNSLQAQARVALSTASAGYLRSQHAASQLRSCTCQTFTLTVTPNRLLSVAVNAALVKKLRDRSAAPMGECKDALHSAVNELGPNVSAEDAVLKKATEILQKKGKAAGLKLSSRVGRDGIIALQTATNSQSPLLPAAAMIEINSETDFAAKSPVLIDVARRMTHTLNNQHTVAGNVDINSFTLQSLSELASSHVQEKLSTVGDALSHVLATLRESIKLRRGFRLQSTQNSNHTEIIGAYVHRSPPSESSGPAVDLNDDTFSFGKTGALVRVSVSAPAPLSSAILSDLQFLANKLAMQVVAFQAKYVDSSQISAAERSAQLQLFIERTKTEMKEKQRSKDEKNDSLIETIAERRLKKYFDEFTLIDQQFVVYPAAANNESVSQILKNLQETIGSGAQIKIKEMVRYQVGEGIEKEEKLDFAAEVQEKLQKAQQKK